MFVLPFLLFAIRATRVGEFQGDQVEHQNEVDARRSSNVLQGDHNGMGSQLDNQQDRRPEQVPIQPGNVPDGIENDELRQNHLEDGGQGAGPGPGLGGDLFSSLTGVSFAERAEQLQNDFARPISIGVGDSPGEPDSKQLRLPRQHDERMQENELLRLQQARLTEAVQKAQLADQQGNSFLQFGDRFHQQCDGCMQQCDRFHREDSCRHGLQDSPRQDTDPSGINLGKEGQYSPSRKTDDEGEDPDEYYGSGLLPGVGPITTPSDMLDDITHMLEDEFQEGQPQTYDQAGTGGPSGGEQKSELTQADLLQHLGQLDMQRRVAQFHMQQGQMQARGDNIPTYHVEGGPGLGTLRPASDQYGQGSSQYGQDSNQHGQWSGPYTEGYNEGYRAYSGMQASQQHQVVAGLVPVIVAISQGQMSENAGWGTDTAWGATSGEWNGLVWDGSSWVNAASCDWTQRPPDSQMAAHNQLLFLNAQLRQTRTRLCQVEREKEEVARELKKSAAVLAGKGRMEHRTSRDASQAASGLQQQEQPSQDASRSGTGPSTSRNAGLHFFDGGRAQPLGVSPRKSVVTPRHPHRSNSTLAEGMAAIRRTTFQLAESVLRREQAVQWSGRAPQQTRTPGTFQNAVTEEVIQQILEPPQQAALSDAVGVASPQQKTPRELPSPLQKTPSSSLHDSPERHADSDGLEVFKRVESEQSTAWPESSPSRSGASILSGSANTLTGINSPGLHSQPDPDKTSKGRVDTPRSTGGLRLPPLPPRKEFQHPASTKEFQHPVEEKPKTSDKARGVVSIDGEQLFLVTHQGGRTPRGTQVVVSELASNAIGNESVVDQQHTGDKAIADQRTGAKGANGKTGQHTGNGKLSEAVILEGEVVCLEDEAADWMLPSSKYTAPLTGEDVVKPAGSVKVDQATRSRRQMGPPPVEQPPDPPAARSRPATQGVSSSSVAVPSLEPPTQPPTLPPSIACTRPAFADCAAGPRVPPPSLPPGAVASRSRIGEFPCSIIEDATCVPCVSQHGYSIHGRRNADGSPVADTSMQVDAKNLEVLTAVLDQSAQFQTLLGDVTSMVVGIVQTDLENERKEEESLVQGLRELQIGQKCEGDKVTANGMVVDDSSAETPTAVDKPPFTGKRTCGTKGDDVMPAAGKRTGGKKVDGALGHSMTVAAIDDQAVAVQQPMLQPITDVASLVGAAAPEVPKKKKKKNKRHAQGGEYGRIASLSTVSLDQSSRPESMDVDETSSSETSTRTSWKRQGSPPQQHSRHTEFAIPPTLLEADESQQCEEENEEEEVEGNLHGPAVRRNICHAFGQTLMKGIRSVPNGIRRASTSAGLRARQIARVPVTVLEGMASILKECVISFILHRVIPVVFHARQAITASITDALNRLAIASMKAIRRALKGIGRFGSELVSRVDMNWQEQMKKAEREKKERQKARQQALRLQQSRPCNIHSRDQQTNPAGNGTTQQLAIAAHPTQAPAKPKPQLTNKDKRARKKGGGEQKTMVPAGGAGDGAAGSGNAAEAVAEAGEAPPALFGIGVDSGCPCDACQNAILVRNHRLAYFAASIVFFFIGFVGRISNNLRTINDLHDGSFQAEIAWQDMLAQQNRQCMHTSTENFRLTLKRMMSSWMNPADILGLSPLATLSDPELRDAIRCGGVLNCCPALDEFADFPWHQLGERMSAQELNRNRSDSTIWNNTFRHHKSEAIREFCKSDLNSTRAHKSTQYGRSGDKSTLHRSEKREDSDNTNDTDDSGDGDGLENDGDGKDGLGAMDIFVGGYTHGNNRGRSAFQSALGRSYSDLHDRAIGYQHGASSLALQENLLKKVGSEARMVDVEMADIPPSLTA